MDRLLDLMNRAKAEYHRTPKYGIGTIEQHLHVGYLYDELFYFNKGLGYPDTDAHELALRSIEQTIDSWTGAPVIQKPTIDLPKPPDPKPVSSDLSLLRIENGRLRNDAGFLHWNGISEFYLPWYVNRDTGLLTAKLDLVKARNRTGPRVLCMVNHPDISYECHFDILDVIYNECITRGLYLEPCLGADWQRIQPNHEDRKALVRDFGQWCKGKFVLPQICNEPQFNGFQSAIDPLLFELVEIFAENYGSRDFSIGDSIDADPDNGNDTAGELKAYIELAKRSNVLVMHPSRYRPDPWRWINHLKGFQEMLGDVKNGSGNYNIYGIHDEPIGAASVDKDNRDSNASHHIAANFVANCCCLGYTAHYIAEQDPNFPGIDVMALAPKIKASPDFVFINAGLGGSPIKSGKNYEKVRPCTNGQEAFAIGYGGNGEVVWDGYNNVEVLFENNDVRLYHAVR